jgi:hypothetical protein
MQAVQIEREGCKSIWKFPQGADCVWPVHWSKGSLIVCGSRETQAVRFLIVCGSRGTQAVRFLIVCDSRETQAVRFLIVCTIPYRVGFLIVRNNPYRVAPWGAASRVFVTKAILIVCTNPYRVGVPYRVHQSLSCESPARRFGRRLRCSFLSCAAGVMLARCDSLSCAAGGYAGAVRFLIVCGFGQSCTAGSGCLTTAYGYINLYMAV